MPPAVAGWGVGPAAVCRPTPSACTHSVPSRTVQPSESQPPPPPSPPHTPCSPSVPRFVELDGAGTLAALVLCEHFRTNWVHLVGAWGGAKGGAGGGGMGGGGRGEGCTHRQLGARGGRPVGGPQGRGGWQSGECPQVSAPTG